MALENADPRAEVIGVKPMFGYLAETISVELFSDIARLIEAAVQQGLEDDELRPKEHGGVMGTVAVT